MTARITCRLADGRIRRRALQGGAQPGGARGGVPHRHVSLECDAMKRLRRDDGMVTAELATALPVLVLLALVAVMIVGLAQARVRCADAAREAARAIARGDPGAA